MRNRLEVTVFGSMYRVAALRFTRSMAKAGMRLYGVREWNEMINAVALDKRRKKLMEQISHTLGHELILEYRAEGILMQGADFGLEVFHRGKFTPLDVVEAENRVMRPRELMKGWSREDLLGVFWGRCDGAMFFRWEDVEELNGEDVALHYDRLSPLLDRKRSLDLVTGVTWQGLKGRRKAGEPKDGFSPLKQVFHVIEA